MALGDAVLITAPTGKTILYDGGPSETRTRKLLRQHNVTRVDLVTAYHMDADHITNLGPAVVSLKPKYALNSSISATPQSIQNLLNVATLVKPQDMKATRRTLYLTAVKVQVLSPSPGMRLNKQNVDIMGLVAEYGDMKAVTIGDSERPQTNAWLHQFGGRCSGRWTSTSAPNTAVPTETRRADQRRYGRRAWRSAWVRTPKGTRRRAPRSFTKASGQPPGARTCKGPSPCPRRRTGGAR